MKNTHTHTILLYVCVTICQEFCRNLNCGKWLLNPYRTKKIKYIFFLNRTKVTQPIEYNISIKNLKSETFIFVMKKINFQKSSIYFIYLNK